MPLLECQFLDKVIPVNEDFPDEQLFLVQVREPWYTDFVNYLVSNIINPDFGYHEKKKFLLDVMHYFWDEPYLFKLYPYRMIY